MLIVCPNCKKRFDLDPASLGDAPKLRCSACKAVFRLVRKPATGEGTATKGRGPLAKGPLPVAPAAPVAPAPAPVASAVAAALPTAPAAALQASASRQAATGAPIKVVVANESAAFCEAVRKVLASEPFQIFSCNDGKVALETVLEVRPQVLLLDVALPTMFGFEVCERVRQNPELSGTRIVLIASIYDKTRYKRSPNSLYGADDYIEKHHIPDALVPMLYRLAGSPPEAKSASAGELAAQEEVRSEIREVEQRETAAAAAQPVDPFDQILAESATLPAADPPAAQAPAAAELSEPEVKARRLARIIVSDIVLYNQGKVEQGVREGNFYELLADDIREGERLYLQRVPEPVREKSSFLQDAFEELIAKKRAELRV